MLSELIRAEIREYVAPMFEQIMARMDTLATKEDLNEVKADVSAKVAQEVKADVSELKVGLNEVRADAPS